MFALQWLCFLVTSCALNFRLECTVIAAFHCAMVDACMCTGDCCKSHYDSGGPRRAGPAANLARHLMKRLPLVPAN